MNHINLQQFKTPYGELVLGSFDNMLCLCDWRYRAKRAAVDNRIKSLLHAEFIVQDDKLLQETRRQLNEFFEHKRKVFELPLLLAGTEYQQQVWYALLKVPFGETSTYLELAKAIKNEKSVRAVGAANGANAIAIIVPCHRIIGKNGALIGYAGGLNVKAKLLTLENDLFN